MTGDMYQDHILEHYENPYNRMALEHPTLELRDLNPLCGDEVRIQACLDDHGHLAQVGFEGKTLAEVKQMDRQEMLDLLGVPLTTMRVKCAMLALRTLQKAIHLYEGQQGLRGEQGRH